MNLLAPNGRPSNLNNEQWHLVRTPSFKEKYGDWEKLAMVKRYDSGIDDITLRNLQKRISVQLDENGEPVFTPELKSQINQVKKKAERNGEITFVSTNERVAYISVIVILGILLVYQYQKQ